MGLFFIKLYYTTYQILKYFLSQSARENTLLRENKKARKFVHIYFFHQT